MTTDRKLMQMALDALDEARDAIAGWGSYASPYFQEKHNLKGDIDDCDAVIEALRAALAQPEPDYETPVHEEVGIGRAAKTPQREWQGLTDEEIHRLKHHIDWTAGWTYGHFARAIETKLKEKNNG